MWFNNDRSLLLRPGVAMELVLHCPGTTRGPGAVASLAITHRPTVASGGGSGTALIPFLRLRICQVST